MRGKEEVIITVKEKRDKKRNQVNLPVIYAYFKDNKITTKHGMTFDLSETGMCFYTDMPLREGLDLQIHVSNMWDFPKSSVVRWCSMKNVHLYRVGVLLR
jgi:hypothetical protein